jgi:hypothetical protein
MTTMATPLHEDNKLEATTTLSLTPLSLTDIVDNVQAK